MYFTLGIVGLGMLGLRISPNYYSSGYHLFVNKFERRFVDNVNMTRMELTIKSVLNIIEASDMYLNTLHVKQVKSKHCAIELLFLELTENGFSFCMTLKAIVHNIRIK